MWTHCAASILAAYFSDLRALQLLLNLFLIPLVVAFFRKRVGANPRISPLAPRADRRAGQLFVPFLLLADEPRRLTPSPG
jgi:hypothetical protein